MVKPFAPKFEQFLRQIEDFLAPSLKKLLFCPHREVHLQLKWVAVARIPYPRDAPVGIIRIQLKDELHPGSKEEVENIQREVQQQLREMGKASDLELSDIKALAPRVRLVLNALAIHRDGGRGSFVSPVLANHLLFPGDYLLVHPGENGKALEDPRWVKSMVKGLCNVENLRNLPPVASKKLLAELRERGREPLLPQ